MIVLKKEIKQVLRRKENVETLNKVAALVKKKPDTVRRKCFSYNENRPSFLTQQEVLVLLSKTFGFNIKDLTTEVK
jgi:hypothetical protein